MTTCRYQFCLDCGENISHEMKSKPVDSTCKECGAAVGHKMDCSKNTGPASLRSGEFMPLKKLREIAAEDVLVRAIVKGRGVPLKPERKRKVPYQPEWLKKHSMGLAHNEDWNCLYEGEAWALIRIPGHMYWSSIGSQRYGKTEFEVIRKSTEHHLGGYINAKVDVAEGCNLPDLDKLKNANVFNVHQGRMNKKLLTYLIDQVKLLDKEKP